MKGNTPMFTTLILAATLGQIPGWAGNADYGTVYESIGAGLVQATVKIRGPVGTYELLGPGSLVGQLSEVRYVPSLARPGDSTTEVIEAVVGRWTLKNATGYFVFRKPTAEGAMDGYWGFFDKDGRRAERRGNWAGKLLKSTKGGQ